MIHPRKEESENQLKVSSIFGTAKSTQEADNIIILQDQKVKKNDTVTSAKFIEVKKIYSRLVSFYYIFLNFIPDLIDCEKSL